MATHVGSRKRVRQDKPFTLSKSLTRRQQRARRLRRDDRVVLRAERLECRQLLTVASDPLAAEVDSGELWLSASEPAAELAQLSFDDLVSDTSFEGDPLNTELVTTSVSAPTSLADTTTFHETVPSGLEGTVVEEKASYFDALTAYYRLASSTIGAEPDTDWSEVTLSLGDDVASFEPPAEFGSFEVLDPLFSPDLFSPDTDSWSDSGLLGDTGWVFEDDPWSLASGNEHDADVGVYTVEDAASQLTDVVDESLLTETPNDVYASLLKGTTESTTDETGTYAASPSATPPLGSHYVSTSGISASAVYPSPQYGTASGSRISVSDTTFSILAGIHNRWDAARANSDASGTDDPATSDPATSDPATSDPATSDPATSDPATSDPATSDPATSDPATSDPATSDAPSVGGLDARNLALPKLPDFDAQDPPLPGRDHDGDLITFKPPTSGFVPVTDDTTSWSSTTTFTDEYDGNCQADIQRTTTVTQLGDDAAARYLESLQGEYLVITSCNYQDGSIRTTRQWGTSSYRLEVFGLWPEITRIDLWQNTYDAHLDTITLGWDDTDEQGGTSLGSTVTRREGWIENDERYDRQFSLGADGQTKIESYSKSKDIQLDDTTTVNTSGRYGRSDPTPGVVDFDKGYLLVSTRDHVFVSTGEAEYRAEDGTMTYYSRPTKMLADGSGQTGTLLSGAEYTSEQIPNGLTWNNYNYLISQFDDYNYDRGIEGQRVNDGSGWKDVPSKSWSSQGNSTNSGFKVWIDAGSKEDIAGSPANIHREDTVYYEVWSNDESSSETTRDVVYGASGGEIVTGSGSASGKSEGGTEVRYAGTSTYDLASGSLADGKGTEDHRWTDYKVHDIHAYSSSYGVGTTTTTDPTTGAVETVGGGGGSSTLRGDAGSHFSGGAAYDVVEKSGSRTETANTFVGYEANSFDKYWREDAYGVALQANGELETAAQPPLMKTWGGSQARLDAWGSYALDDIVGTLPLGDGETKSDFSGYFIQVSNESNYEFRFDTPGALASQGVVSNAHSHMDGKGESHFKAWGTYDYDYRKDAKEIHDHLGLEIRDDETYEYDFTYRALVKDDGSISVGGGGFDESKEAGKSKFYGHGSYDDSLETGDFASGEDGSSFAETHGYDFEFTDEYEYLSNFGATATSGDSWIDERNGYLNSVVEKGASRSKVWGSVEETTRSGQDDSHARIDYESWDKSEYQAHDLELGTPVAHDFLQIEGQGTTSSSSAGGSKIDGQGHANHYRQHADYAAGDGWETTAKNVWSIDLDDRYLFYTNLTNERSNFHFSGPRSLTAGDDFGQIQYDAKYTSVTDSTYDQKHNGGDYESHSKTTREVKANDEFVHFHSFKHSMFTDTNNYAAGSSMPVGKSYERASSRGHDKSNTIADGKEYWSTSWSSGDSFDNHTYDATWQSNSDSGSSYDIESESVTTKLHFTGWGETKSHHKTQAWGIGDSKYETKDHHLYAHHDPVYGSGGEEILHTTDESNYRYESKYEQQAGTQADGTYTTSEDSSTSDSSVGTSSWNNTYTNWYTDPAGGVTTTTWIDADSTTYSFDFNESLSHQETTPGNGSSGDSPDAKLSDPWSDLFKWGAGSSQGSSGRWFSPWRWMWTGDGHASDEIMNGALVAAGNSIKDNDARKALKVMATVDPTPLSGCIEATISGVENGDSAKRIAGNCAIEAIPVPGLAQAKNAARVGKNAIQGGAQKAAKQADNVVSNLRVGKSTAKINCFVAGTPTHVVQESASPAVGNVVMAISLGVFVTSEYVDRKRRKQQDREGGSAALQGVGLGTAMDELEPDDDLPADDPGMMQQSMFRHSVDYLMSDSCERATARSGAVPTAYSVDYLMSDSCEQEMCERGVATAVLPLSSRARRGSSDLSSDLAVTEQRSFAAGQVPCSETVGDENERTRARREPVSLPKAKPTDISWTRSIGILALCASLLFGLFSWVPNDRGPITVTRPIQLVRAGQRVLVDAPEEALAADFARLTGAGLSWDQADGSWHLGGEIDPLRDIEQATSQQITRADYRLIQIQARSAWEDGTVDEINIETLQPVAWIHDNRVRVGGNTKLPIDALEMGLPDELTGKVLDILPCPPLREGPGRIVLTTVNHLNRDVVELALRDVRGRMETLRPTGTHKFYSVTRGEWLSAADLAQGEHLDGVRGKVTVAAIRRVPGTHRVYNLTVQGEHLYRVAHCGVLVHNNHCDVVSEISLANSGKKIDLNSTKGAAELSRGAFLRQKYGHYTPAQRQARIAELAEGNRVLREAGVPRQYISEALQSFQPGTITSRAAGEADFGLRFYGGVSGPKSPYLSPTFPLGDVRQLSAVPEGNTLQNIIQYQIRPGTAILEGKVRPAFGQPGGGRQIYVPDFFNNLLPAN